MRVGAGLGRSPSPTPMANGRNGAGVWAGGFPKMKMGRSFALWGNREECWSRCERTAEDGPVYVGPIAEHIAKLKVRSSGGRGLSTRIQLEYLRHDVLLKRFHPG